MTNDPLYFPYMVWAHEESARSSWCLSQSGMPMADPHLFADVGPPDLGHASVEALPALEARLAELFGTEPERVVATAGASAAMFACAARWFRPGSRVACEVPSYEALRALPALFGADLAPVARRLEHGWDLDPEDVAQRLAGARPGHVFATNPHNPSGTRLEADRMVALAAEAARAGGVLVACEVYMEYLPNDRRVHAFALAPNAVSIGSLTKAYGLGALRIGWLILGDDLVAQRAHVVDRLYLAYVDPATTCLRAGLHALDHLPELLQPLRRVEREARPAWERWLSTTPGVTATVPEHGIIAFPRIDDVSDSLALSRYLQDEHEVDTVPGEFFGQAGHLRVGCGVPAATLVEGLERLTRGIEAWRAR